MLTIYCTDMQLLQLKNGSTFVATELKPRIGDKVTIKHWQTCKIELIAVVSDIICGSIIKIEEVKINEMR